MLFDFNFFFGVDSILLLILLLLINSICGIIVFNSNGYYFFNGYYDGEKCFNIFYVMVD